MQEAVPNFSKSSYNSTGLFFLLEKLISLLINILEQKMSSINFTK